MFARALSAPGLRAASFRALPRAAPRVSAPVIRRNMSATAKRDLNNEVRRGFDEIVPFLKRIPVDVYPLVAFVSFVCCLGVFFSAKNIMTDKSLRLKPTGAQQE